MKKVHAQAFVLFVLLFTWLIVPAADCTTQQETLGQTPPRLSLTEGQISFWRPGATEWTEAQINTPLAPGDQLYAGSPGNLELQIGSDAFVRAGERTQIGFENHEPDFLQFKVTTGVAAFDLRSIASGHTLEVDTPNAAFTIEHMGYYRVEVNGDRTAFISRRAGEATVIPAGGEADHIAPGEEVVVEGVDNARTSYSVAPPLDKWDKWNYARTDKLLDAASAGYVSPDVYGVADLDSAGTWRVIPTYGTVWVPSDVPAGWAPYTTGAWIRDPYYGWTWVDTASWGWAPYHYGRWVHVDNFWCWAPGPVMARPHYAPALVAFLGAGVPGVTWVALGWGEPLVPWWGPPGFRHRPWWGGWHGPRFVNNRAIRRTTVVRVENITVYRNTRVRHGLVSVPERYFGHGRITRERLVRVDTHRLRPTHKPPGIRATSAGYAPRTVRGFRPPDKILRRTVVATRPPRFTREPSTAEKRLHHPSGRPAASPRIVSVPPPHEPTRRPQTTIERSVSNHPRKPEPRKFVKPRTPPAKTHETSRPRSQARPSAGASGPRSHEPAAKRPLPANHRPVPMVNGPSTTDGKPVHHTARKPRALPGEPATHRSPPHGRPESFQKRTLHGAPHAGVQRKPSAQPDRKQHAGRKDQRSNRRNGQPANPIPTRE